MLTKSTRLFDLTLKLLLLSQRECITKLNEHLSLGQEPLPHVTMLGIGLPSVSCFHDLRESQGNQHVRCFKLEIDFNNLYDVETLRLTAPLTPT